MTGARGAPRGRHAGQARAGNPDATAHAEFRVRFPWRMLAPPPRASDDLVVPPTEATMSSIRNFFRNLARSFGPGRSREASTGIGLHPRPHPAVLRVRNGNEGTHRGRAH